MNKAAVEARKEAAAEKMAVTINVNELLRGWRGQVLDVVDQMGNIIPPDNWTEDQKPCLGNTLLNLLATMQPENPRQQVLVGHIAGRIVEAMQGDGELRATETIVAILRVAAKQNAARVSNPVMGKVWEAIGLGGDEGPPTLD